VRVGEPSPILGWRDSWLIRYVCHACRHYYLDFRKQMTQQEAEAAVSASDAGISGESAVARESD
jgi:hypothetical protein